MLRGIYHKWQSSRVRKAYAKAAIFHPDTHFFTCATCFNTGTKENVRIGQHCYIGCHIQAQYGGKISIGNNVYIGGATMLQCKESITIKDNVIIANNTLLLDNNNHPTDPAMRLKMSQCDDFLLDPLWRWEQADSGPIVIEENVWIGRDVRILKGVTVGKGSIVALGSIVTRDVPPYTIVAGNPARVVKQLTKPENDV